MLRHSVRANRFGAGTSPLSSETGESEYGQGSLVRKACQGFEFVVKSHELLASGQSRTSASLEHGWSMWFREV